MEGGHSDDQKYKYVLNKRRINGLQLPFNYQQISLWAVFILTALINFLVMVKIQFEELEFASMVTFIILYSFHIISHVFALVLDPGEEELRKRETVEVPEFDRDVHTHVIENGRCHLCNIYTSDKKTKHCGICNKCVYKFDHHCKWLNNCVGKRNYYAFIGCVCTALFISSFTFCLCISDVISFSTNPTHLGQSAVHFINCSSVERANNYKYCANSITFLLFLIIYLICGVAVTCALLHLLCFHFYISVLGISTYEYIIRNKSSPFQFRCIRMPNFYLITKGNNHTSKRTELKHNEQSVTNLVSVLLNYELEKARKLIQYKNKIHPSQELEHKQEQHDKSHRDHKLEAITSDGC